MPKQQQPNGTPGKKPPAWIERTYVAANTDGHVPQAATTATADKTKWHVYKLAAKRQWVGEIEAVDEREAIEIAAKEFKQSAKKLMAVRQR
jgi:hypothetical protein